MAHIAKQLRSGAGEDEDTEKLVAKLKAYIAEARECLNLFRDSEISLPTCLMNTQTTALLHQLIIRNPSSG